MGQGSQNVRIDFSAYEDDMTLHRGQGSQNVRIDSEMEDCEVSGVQAQREQREWRKP